MGRKQIVYWEDIEDFSDEYVNGFSQEEYDEMIEHEIQLLNFQEKIDNALFKTIFGAEDNIEKRCFSLFARSMNIHNVSRETDIHFQKVKSLYEKFIVLFTKNLFGDDTPEKIQYVETYFKEKRKKS